jgi:urease accessory protein UreE
VSIYRLHDATGDDLGLLEHPAPNLEPGDVIIFADGQEVVVTARVEAEAGPGPLVAMLEVAIAPSRVEAGDALP